MIRAVIVDDEPLAGRRIRRMLQNDSEVEVLSVHTRGEDALKTIEIQKPELLFLDVQMPGMDGFQLLEALGPGKLPQVIFVTAYDRYALQAFEVHALDYLLKPFDRERFEKAVQRAKEMIQQGLEQGITRELISIREELKAKPRYVERLVVKSGGRIFFLKTREIDWFEAQGKYVAIHAGKETHMIRDGLTSLEADLHPQRFVRIHRSTIVNVDRIKELQPWFHGDCKVVLYDGTQLMLSRHYRQRLEQLIGSSF